MRNYRLALIGFGGVNRALATIIGQADAAFWSGLGFTVTIVAASDIMVGSVVAPDGIAPHELLAARPEDGGFTTLPGGRQGVDNAGIIADSDADIVVEATPTNAETGEPAVSLCRWALAAGRHVVTVNKGPVAFAGAALTGIAQAHGVSFEYEGAVMSGTPVLRMATHQLRGAGITGFSGILNGTSNFVLGRMEAGHDQASAIAEAQALGYAEANPEADIEGYDVRLKVVILANALLGSALAPEDVTCVGIGKLTPDEIAQAREAGRRWKLVGAAWRDDTGRVLAEVAPAALPHDHPLAGVSGVTNAISFDTGMLGNVTVVGPGAGRVETAYALLSDIIAIHDRQVAGTPA